MKTAIPVRAGSSAPASSYKLLRQSLAQIRLLRSSYRLTAAIGELLSDAPGRKSAELEREFLNGPDPWNYVNDPEQHLRIHGELAVLDAVMCGRFGNVLEIGCAEGIFTDHLATRCDSLLAVDISPTALARARERCRSHDNIRFLDLDIRTGSLNDKYDLIVAIHSIEYLKNPAEIRRARTKLVEWLRHGGYLLLGTMKEIDAIEDSWWSRFLLRGGGRINAFFEKHPELHVVRRAQFRLDGDRVSTDVLFHKSVSAAPGHTTVGESSQ